MAESLERGPDPTELELQSIDAIDNAREILVEVVGSYRDIKAHVVARAAGRRKEKEKRTAKKRKMRGSKP